MPSFKTYGFDVDTKRYLAAVDATGGAISYQSALAVNGLVTNLKASGIWDKLYEVGPFAGSNLSAACTKLKWHPAAGPYLISTAFTSANYTERGQFGGLSGNGSTMYLNTNFTPLLYTPFFASFSTYAGNYSQAGAGARLLGAEDSVADNRFRISSVGAGPTLGAGASAGTTFSNGLIAASRLNSTNLFAFNNGSGAGVNSSPTTGFALSYPIYLFARSLDGPTAASFYNGTIQAYTLGEYLNSGENVALSTSLNDFQRQLGRNAY